MGAAVIALAAMVDEVVVVDDGSADRTAAEAERAGARVLRLGRGRGKGYALAAGCDAVAGAEVILLADADLGASAANLRPVLEPVLDGRADIAVAAPRPGAPSGFGLVEAFARWGIRRTTGRTVSRPLSGQRAIRAEVIGSIRFAGGFGVETAMTIDALRAGFRLLEVPCDFTHARTGRTIAGFVHRFRQGFDIARALRTRLAPGGRKPSPPTGIPGRWRQ